MKLHQQNAAFNPVTIVFETQRELEVFWDMVLRIKKFTDKDAEYEMARIISNWISNNAKLL